MDRVVYQRMSELEDAHWWFSARRLMIQTILGRLVTLPDDPKILEAGCGTGGNLKLLQSFGATDAFEFDASARQFATEKLRMPVPFGALPDTIPFARNTYDLICLFDVLEHIEDDLGSLKSLASHLARGGQIVLTVPAFPALWSRHDERHHHFRRCTAKSMARLAQAASQKITDDGYFNTVLLPLAVTSRAINGLLRREVADEAMPGPVLNNMLFRIFASERHLIGRLRMPVGLSYFAVLSPQDEG